MTNKKSETLNQKQKRNYKLEIVSYFVFRISLICFAFLISNFVLAGKISASEISLVVSPPRTDLEGKPGEILQQTIKVTNNTVETIYLKAFVSDFIVQDDLGTPIKVSVSASGRYLASPWFTLDQTELTLGPKETAQVVAVISVPADALPGGHYAGVFFESVPGKKASNTVSYATAQVGSLFGITTPGDIKYDALIKDFSTKSRLFEFGPVDFTAIIENQSDTHISTKGKITVENMIGQDVAEIVLDDVNVFPFTSRTLRGNWDRVWGLGRYMATLSVAYGPGLEVSRTIYFWILPYRLIAAVIVVILVLLALFIVIRRHLKHREDSRDEEIDELKRKIAEMENRVS